MSMIQFKPEEKESIVLKLKSYMEDELEKELSRFEAEFLLEFISKEIGPHFYNHGLYDALAVFNSQVENITDAVYEIEKQT